MAVGILLWTVTGPLRGMVIRLLSAVGYFVYKGDKWIKMLDDSDDSSLRCVLWRGVLFTYEIIEGACLGWPGVVILTLTMSYQFMKSVDVVENGGVTLDRCMVVFEIPRGGEQLTVRLSGFVIWKNENKRIDLAKRPSALPEELQTRLDSKFVRGAAFKLNVVRCGLGYEQLKEKKKRLDEDVEEHACSPDETQGTAARAPEVVDRRVQAGLGGVSSRSGCWPWGGGGAPAHHIMSPGYWQDMAAPLFVTATVLLNLRTR
ncbi:hypothetical protein GQ600_24339 [Phytophthora cactorum]|nr:hypothetical protein GQ600_24339 [Phytophthora cactorum]